MKPISEYIGRLGVWAHARQPFLTGPRFAYAPRRHVNRPHYADNGIVSTFLLTRHFDLVDFFATRDADI
jgi:hypothetical protein